MGGRVDGWGWLGGACVNYPYSSSDSGFLLPIPTPPAARSVLLLLVAVVAAVTAFKPAERTGLLQICSFAVRAFFDSVLSPGDLAPHLIQSFCPVISHLI